MTESMRRREDAWKDLSWVYPKQTLRQGSGWRHFVGRWLQVTEWGSGSGREVSYWKGPPVATRVQTLRGKHGACLDLPTERRSNCAPWLWVQKSGNLSVSSPSLVETHETVRNKLQVASKKDRGNMDRTAPATRSMTRSECEQWERLLIVLNPREDCTESMNTHR